MRVAEVSRMGRWVVVAALAVGLAGCQKLNVEKKVSVEGAGYNELTVDPAKSAQTVAVEFESKGNPVNVYLVLGKDEDAAKGDLKKGGPPANVVAKLEKSEQGTVEAKVPANEKLLVYLTSSNGKDANVNVKLTNK